MKKIDLAVTCVVISIMILCFSLGGKWPFFFAGICAAAIFFVCIGRLAGSMDRNRNGDAWNNFLDKLDNEGIQVEGNSLNKTHDPNARLATNSLAINVRLN